MVKVLPTLAVVLTLVLFGGALLSMARGSYGVAGFCFLSASVVIYLRETYLLDN